MPKRTAHETYTCQSGCPVEATLDVIGGKWKGVILYNLFETRRFSELQRRIPGVNRRMLTLQLRELEGDGLVHREVYQVVPPRVEYSLTEFGRTLTPLIEGMKRWGEGYMARLQEAQNPSQAR